MILEYVTPRGLGVEAWTYGDPPVPPWEMPDPRRAEWIAGYLDAQTHCVARQRCKAWFEDTD